MPKKITRRTFVGTSVRLAVVSPVIRLGPVEAAAQATVGFPAAERRILQTALDVIIPAEGRMPAATAVGGLDYIERITTTDSKMRALLVTGVRALDADSRATVGVPFAASRTEQQAGALARAEKADSPPGFVAALRDVVYEAYYTQPKVWNLLGYTFRHSSRRTAALESFDERRVARVRDMAPFYRQVSS